MAKNFKHISHIKSRVTRDIIPEEFHGLTPTADNSDAENSSPVKLNLAKRPTADKLVEGEIAVNYLKGHETLMIKNTEDEIVGFVNENELYETQEIIAKGLGKLKNEMKEFDEGIEDLELVTSAALNDLNSRINGVEDEVDNLNVKIDENYAKLTKVIDDDGLVISSSLNDLNERVNDLNGMNDEINTLKITIKALSNILTKGHEYVDLGLPSGTLWATMNVGATKPEEYGWYFAWGETQGYPNVSTKTFTWANYKFNPTGDGSTMTKYNATDGKTVLDLEDDAAHVNWGGEWHMPTKEQCDELFDTTYVTNAWVTDYQGSGVNGFLFTSVKNGNTVFIPTAGSYDENNSISDVGHRGYVWASTLDSNGVVIAWGFGFGISAAGVGSGGYRCGGLSVRAVIG